MECTINFASEWICFGFLTTLKKIDIFSQAFHLKLLNNGLNFCPTLGYYNKNELTRDFNNFSRQIKLKAYFGTQPLVANTFKPETKRTREPPYTHHTVKTFIGALEKELENNTDNKKLSKKQNLTREERRALHNLKHRERRFRYNTSCQRWRYCDYRRQRLYGRGRPSTK